MPALLIVLLLQDPSLDDLLRDLKDDSIDVRAKASAELTRRGESVRDRLVRERDQATDVELKSRLDDLLASIEREKRRAGFKGGKVVEGLRAALTAEQDKATGEAVFRVEIMNVDSKSGDLVEIDAWDHHTPMRPDRAGEDTRRSHAHAQVSIGFDPPKIYPEGTVLKGSTEFTCFEELTRKVVRLQPGESRVYFMRLKLQPDGYKARVTYYLGSKKLLPGATEDLVTDVATFRIE